MAITLSTNGFDAAPSTGRTFFHRKSDELREAMARRKVYRATLSELSGLSTRELADLGIPRCNIKRLAMETAYGC